MHFSTNLKYLRELSKLTQKHLEEILNLKKGSYSAYESKSVFPRMNVIFDMHKLFALKYKDLTLDNLFYDDLRIVQKEDEINPIPLENIPSDNVMIKDEEVFKRMLADKNIGNKLMDKYVNAIAYK